MTPRAIRILDKILAFRIAEGEMAALGLVIGFTDGQQVSTAAFTELVGSSDPSPHVTATVRGDSIHLSATVSHPLSGGISIRTCIIDTEGFVQLAKLEPAP